MCVNARAGGGRVRLLGEVIRRVQDVKYVNGRAMVTVIRRWRNGSKQVGLSGGMFQVCYVIEQFLIEWRRKFRRRWWGHPWSTMTLKRQQMTEINMSRFPSGMTKSDRIWNDLIKRDSQGKIFLGVRESHMQRRDSEYPDKRVMRMDPPGKRAWRRPVRKWQTWWKKRWGQLMLERRMQKIGSPLSWIHSMTNLCRGCKKKNVVIEILKDKSGGSYLSDASQHNVKRKNINKDKWSGPTLRSRLARVHSVFGYLWLMLIEPLRERRWVRCCICLSVIQLEIIWTYFLDTPLE